MATKNLRYQTTFNVPQQEADRCITLLKQNSLVQDAWYTPDTVSGTRVFYLSVLTTITEQDVFNLGVLLGNILCSVYKTT